MQAQGHPGSQLVQERMCWGEGAEAWVRECSATEKLNRSWSQGLETGLTRLGQWEYQPILAKSLASESGPLGPASSQLAGG